MNFADYYPLALRTAKPMPTQRAELRHCLFGLATEMGEFFSEVKRVVIYDKLLSAEMHDHMCEELGDTQWYVPLAIRALGLTPADLKYDLDEQMTRYFDTLGDIIIPASLMLGVVAAAIVELDDGRAIDMEFTVAMLGGLVFLVDRTAILLGTTGDRLRADNIAKLQKRFPGAFSNEAAEARADKSGVDHRNS